MRQAKKPIKVGNTPVPPEYRVQLKRAAGAVYNYVSSDMDQMSKSAWVEVILDAGRIDQLLANDTRDEYTPDFKAWFKLHGYDLEFSKDMEKAVREIV